VRLGPHRGMPPALPRSANVPSLTHKFCYRTENLLHDVRYVYDGWNLLASLNPASSVRQAYLWGLDMSGTMQGAGGVGGLLAITDASQGSHFCAYDGNGNVTALVKADGAGLTAQYEYGPFGELLSATGPMAKANPFRFSTKYQDDETDLIYYGYRYYNASTGRWPSRDPFGEVGGLNLMGFTDNNPVDKWDILGQETPGKQKCQQMVNNALAKQSELIDLLKKHDCKNPKVKCKCCGDADLVGYYRPKFLFWGNTITMCQNNLGDDQSVYDTVLKHEMLHAVQSCYKEKE